MPKDLPGEKAHAPTQSSPKHVVGLWQQAWDNLSQDPKTADLVAKYKVVLGQVADELKQDDGQSGNRDPQREMQEVVTKSLDRMTKKQWTLQWGEKRIVFRDQAERIVKLVKLFSSFGTTAATLDPLHAGLPWAGICVLLPIVLNDSTQQKEVIDGLEEVSKLVARYAVAEDMAAGVGSPKSLAYQRAITSLYEAIIEFQAKASHHFYRRTPGRMMSNIAKTVDWADLREKMKKRDEECTKLRDIFSQDRVLSKIESLDDGLRSWRQEDEDRHKYIFSLIGKWRDQMSGQHERERAKIDFVAQWIENMMQDKQSCLDANAKIVAWISNVQVGESHARIREKLGSQYWNTGQWFLSPQKGQPDPYKVWRHSRRGQLWIQGFAGTGKSSLESLVIHDLVKNPASEYLAFFYCFRTVTDSSNTPLAIIRSLVAQLACSNDGMEVAEEIKLQYERESSQFITGTKLSIDASVDLLVHLINVRGSTTIVVDALDECTAPNRLLTCLRKVWDNTDCLKVFFTSRLHIEVTSPLAFPEATIVRSGSGSDTTSDDIQAFIRKELEHEGRRNPEVITENLAERMVSILTHRAQGMFRWVELQLELLISEEHPIRYRKDFEARLDLLEEHSGQEVSEALRETYDEIFQRNTQGEHSYRLAKKTLNWVIAAFEPLSFPALFKAVIIDEDSDVTPALIKRICSNFVVIDNQGFARFGHFSVREYLEAKLVHGAPEFSTVAAHLQAATTCLRYLSAAPEEIADDYWDFGKYAYHHWLSHWATYRLDLAGPLDVVFKHHVVTYIKSLPTRSLSTRHLRRDNQSRNTLLEATMRSKMRLQRRPLDVEYEGPSVYAHLGLTFFDAPPDNDKSLTSLHNFGRQLILCSLSKNSQFVFGSKPGLLFACRPFPSRHPNAGHQAFRPLPADSDASLAMLTMNGFNVNARDWQGRSVAHLAILNDSSTLTRFIFGDDFKDTESHVGEVNPESWLPLNFELIQNDARQSVDMNATDDGGNTPLHLAIKQSHIPAARTLLADSRTNPNIRDVYGIAPLHTASAFSLEITKILLANPRITPLVEDNYGRTALYYASSIEIFMALVESDAFDAPELPFSKAATRKYDLPRIHVPTFNILLVDQKVTSPPHNEVLFGKEDVLKVLLGDKFVAKYQQGEDADLSEIQAEIERSRDEGVDECKEGIDATLRTRDQDRDREKVNITGDVEYEIEEVLASRTRRGKLAYRVRWLNWDEDLEWYPASDLKYSPSKLKAYHVANPSQSGPSRALPAWLKAHEDGVDNYDNMEDDRVMDKQAGRCSFKTVMSQGGYGAC